MFLGSMNQQIKVFIVWLDYVRKLRFDHEKRKIVCAKKYFKTLGIDYRAISTRTTGWWEKE